MGVGQGCLCICVCRCVTRAVLWDYRLLGDAIGHSEPALDTMTFWMQPDGVGHGTGVCASVIWGRKTNLWSLQPSPAQRTFLYRVHSALEIEDASPLAMILKRVKPPPHGECGHQPCPLKTAAGFLPALPLAETSFAPKGRHLFMWVYSYQVLCMCICTCNYPTIIPPCSSVRVHAGS